MNPDEAKEEAKTHLLDYLNSKGIDTSRNFTCLNPSHDDLHPSMVFDAKRNKCHCFSCNVDYDIFDIIQIDTGLSGSNLFNHVYGLYNIQINQKNFPPKINVLQQEDFSAFFDRCHAAVEKTDYWKKRGLSKQTVDHFKLGFWEEKNRFVIPTGKSSYNARAIWDADKKERYLKPKGHFELFNLSAITTAEEPVFIVEGEFDALSVLEAGGQAVAFGSSGNIKFAEYLKSNHPKYPLILALDNDDAGILATQKLKSELEKIGIESVALNIAGSYKDANEALVNDRTSFEQAVQEAKENVFSEIKKEKEKEEKDYYKTSAAYEIQDFIDGVEKRFNRECISTGFKSLDETLDGGFYPGLYIIGAVSSLGKTTFALQVADTVAGNGNDVLVFSLEMAKQELIAKSLSRISLNLSVTAGNGSTFATTTRNILNGKALKSKEQVEFLNGCVRKYAQYAGRIFYHIGIGDIGVDEIKAVIERHIKITGRKPLVVIDYLQILSPFDVRATDKQNTDKAVVELKRASRDYDVPIFAISSFNRENYTSPVNIASFKESGAIEYTSDVLMALQFRGMDYIRREDGKFEDEKSRAARIQELRAEQEKRGETPGSYQDLQLKILKNRNGRKGSVDFNFYPMFNYFKEETKLEEKSGWVLKSRK